MKYLFSLSILLFSLVTANGQGLQSGIYDQGLKIAVDSSTNELTGYFENFTGWDEETNSPRFSCSFFIQGIITPEKLSIKTYYPNENEAITGFIEINEDGDLNIKLMEEHGGCWNVQPFTDEPVEFSLEEKKEWISLKFVTAKKAFFYSEKSEDKKRKAYIIKNDYVAVERNDGDWAYCVFQGKSIIKGWIKVSDLN